MPAVFGAIGAVPAGELHEMGRRLTHRGGSAIWTEVAPRVYLGQVANEFLRAHIEGTLSIVIDAPEGLMSGSTSRVLEALLNSCCATNLDQQLTLPFAFAVWDDSQQTLLLGRDYLGLKPLHWCRLPSGGLAFATEYKALLAISEVPAAADLDAVRCLQMYKAVPSGKTLVKDIFPIPPGSVVQFRRNGVISADDRMPDVRLVVHRMTEEQACAQLRRALEQATMSLVRGRSRIGLALGGGIDSMSTAFLARHCAPSAELIAFTARECLDDPQVHRAASAMTCLRGTHHVLVVPSVELTANLPAAVWYLENPIGRSETFQYLAIAKLARERGFNSLLTGIGADLLFGGMPRHKVLWLAEVMPFLRKDLLAFFETTQTGEAPARPLARLMTALYYRGGLPPAPAVLNCERAFEPELLAEPGPEFINRCLMLDVQEPTSRSLARIERPFQAHGVDYGSPFLDKAVIEFAFTVPSRLKIRRGQQKYILRQAMRSLMPDSLCSAPKDLMRMEQGSEFINTLQALADQFLSVERIRHRGFFDHADIDRIRRACKRALHPETSMRLWTAIVTEIWAELFLDGRGRHPEAVIAAHGSELSEHVCPHWDDSREIRARITAHARGFSNSPSKPRSRHTDSTAERHQS
jgi:asparagine synthase (glutamine-hydrolysing)